MSNKITKVQIKEPKPSKLPNGLYWGVWGGNIIEVKYNTKTYVLTTEEGVRGMGIKVVVRINNESLTFEECNS